MAQRVITTLVSDVDGGEADETVTFGLDGVTYEIDLSSSQAAELRDAFAKWTTAGRRVGRSSATARPARARDGRADSDAAAIREWAKGAGLEISERGRVSSEIRAKYEAR
ncbi:Lsr2 family protein [Cellulomonas sp. JH27-2]|uniref:histone-like nucleoid-structuring protein Lsr2 n=1 Tax=Cellulomonas sp. JH27-2 TaxID=2774139 RepID=UPI00178135E6|nr:Lsr2 family protein [Cellulomonas sp. JH27-2]MBD8059038.1 Lsr2 family protein [Cellulomonas sp. JH27-2]